MAVTTIAAGFSLWRNIRFQRFLVQAAFALLLVAFAYYLYEQASDVWEKRRLGFEFLRSRAGFDISHQFGTSFDRNDSRLDLYIGGVVNTIRLAGVGIALATLLGLVAGVARLSRNWLVSRLAMVYVEAIRNTPLLIQIVFWYTAVILQLPKIGDSISVFDVAFLSNRALALPWARPAAGFDLWLLFLLVAIVAAAAARLWRRQRQERTGQPSYPNWFGLGIFAAIALVGFALTGGPLNPDIPALREGGLSYDGGLKVSPEFAGIMLALVIYTGAFIAEVVRGAIQAIPKGQTEAAAALGLNPFQRLSLVILPQAMRIIIPPLTSQYLNLTKNSSLAVAIGFPDLFNVSGTIINNTGQTLPMFAIIMANYLFMSLTISLVMNTLHWRLTLEGR